MQTSLKLSNIFATTHSTTLTTFVLFPIGALTPRDLAQVGEANCNEAIIAARHSNAYKQHQAHHDKLKCVFVSSERAVRFVVCF